MKTYKELYESARKGKTTRQLTPEYHKWDEKGEVIVGAFISSNVVQSRLGGSEYNQYIFETDQGHVKFALGRAADSEIGPVLVKGAVYAITYKGKDKISGGRQVNRFEVEEVGIADMVDETEEELFRDDGEKYQK